MAEDGLARRGRGEAQLLTPIHDRLMRGLNPAQRVRAIFGVDGIPGLLRHAVIRPAIFPAR